MDACIGLEVRYNPLPNLLVCKDLIQVNSRYDRTEVPARELGGDAPGDAGGDQSGTALSSPGRDPSGGHTGGRSGQPRGDHIGIGAGSVTTVLQLIRSSPPTPPDGSGFT